MFKLNCGVLSHYLLAVYTSMILLNWLYVNQLLDYTCHSIFVSIIFYAEVILLLAPFIDSLQKLVNLCETELSALDLAINVKESVCTRTGSWCVLMLPIVGDDIVQWVDTVRYLMVHLLFVLDHSSVVLITPNKSCVEHSIIYMVE